VWAIARDHRGLIYFGVSAGTVVEFDGAAWRKVYFSSSIARSLTVDEQGKIWVGGSGTFGYLAPDQAGRLQYVSIADNIPTEARQFSDVWQVLPTKQGVYFRAVEELFRWDGQQMHFWNPAGKGRFVVDNHFVLPVDAPVFGYLLSQVNPNLVFASTSSPEGKRVAFFARQQDGSWKKDEDTYRQLTRYVLFGAHQDADGSLWFPGVKVLRYDTKGASQAVPQPFATLVRQVNVGTKTIFGGVSTGGAEASLPAGSNALTFQFAAINFGNPADTVYQYLLEGVDKKWSAWSKEKAAN
jgi:hypothetical protein